MLGIAGTLAGVALGVQIEQDHDVASGVGVGVAVALGAWFYAALLVLFVRIADNVEAIRGGLFELLQHSTKPDEDTGEWPLAGSAEEKPQL